MIYGAQTSRYLEAEILSRPKEWLVPLLYEHMLSALRRAAVQIEDGDIAGKAASLDRASGIVLELSASLDREQGGQLASNLAGLYSFFVAEIMAVGHSLDTARLERVIGMVADLHDAWAQAAEAMSPRGRGIRLPAA